MWSCLICTNSEHSCFSFFTHGIYAKSLPLSIKSLSLSYPYSLLQFLFAKKDKNGLLYISTVKKNIPYWYLREPDKRFDLERMRPSSSFCVCIFRTHYAIQLNKKSVPVIFIPCSTSQMDECLSQQFLDKIRGMMQWCVLHSSESVALLFSFCMFPFPV